MRRDLRHRAVLRAILLATLASSAAGCAVNTAETTACEDLAVELTACVGEVPEGFVDQCTEGPEAAARTVSGACLQDGKSDLIEGWIDDGGRCFNFNFECVGDLTCRPERADERVHTCRPQGLDHPLCDDDADCGTGARCVNEQTLGLSDAFSGNELSEAGFCVALTGDGGRCYNFNFQCTGDLVCRPYSEDEEEQFCLPPTASGHCDDDADCAPGLYCLEETGYSAGTCKRVLDRDERCFNFNSECQDGLVCRPVAQDSSEQFCTAPVPEGETCDDDDDCLLPSYCSGWNRCRQ